MEAAQRTTEKLVAVLIDFENVGLDSIQWLFDQMSDVGRTIVKRAYADWSDAGNKRDQLLELGIEPVQQFHAGPIGKNSSDIRLVIDAVDLLHQSTMDIFVIVSSDSDFVPLVNKLRSAGKTVIGAGRKATTPRTLVISCDKYYYLDDSRTTVEPPRPDKKQEGTDSLVIRAVKATIDEQGRATGSKVHQAMQRLDPGFDYRALGFPTFTKYLESLKPLVKIKRPKGPGDIIVELADTVAPGLKKYSTPNDWENQIDTAWSRVLAKYNNTIPGPVAAVAAAKVLGVSKLKDSKYKTLQGLIESSGYLNTNWSRNGNTILKR